MRFEVEQRYSSDPDTVARAYADASLYELLVSSKIGRPSVLERDADASVVRMRIRYAFTGELSSAARAAIDPAKLTWIEQSTHDLATRTTKFVLLPDHYRNRFSCSGTYRFEQAGSGTLRRTEAELQVRAPLVGRLVEQAIVSGLREHLDAEVPIVEQLIASRP